MHRRAGKQFAVTEVAKMKCNECNARAACRFTFGEFLIYKSHGGTHCDHPLDEQTARAIMAVVEHAQEQAAARTCEQLELAL